MAYKIAGIDVHKKMLAVVVSDVEVDGDYQFERRLFGSNPEQLRSLAEWLLEQEVEEAVMESTAQYWKPVWGALERLWKPIRQKREGAGPMSGALHLAQAQSNRGPQGRKKDFPDAERLVKRLVARELTLSFVPDPDQRLWRTVMRRKYQLTRNRVQLQNRIESLLEEAHIKLSSFVSNLLGVSARRMLKALADGETNPASLAALADRRLRATPEQLCDALGVHGSQPHLSAIAKDDARGVAIDRRTNCQTGQGDGQLAPAISRPGKATGGGPRSGSRFGPADSCRSWLPRGGISFRQAPVLVGRGMPGRQSERRRELQSPVP